MPQLNNSLPIKNNGGTVKSKGDLSALSTTPRGQTDSNDVKNSKITLVKPQDTASVNGLDLGGLAQPPYSDNTFAYTGKLLDIQRLTNQPTGVTVSYDSFQMDSNYGPNNLTSFVYLIGGRKSQYRYVPIPSENTEQFDMVSTTFSQEITFTATKRAFTFYNGNINIDDFTLRTTTQANYHTTVLAIGLYQGALLAGSIVLNEDIYSAFSYNIPEGVTRATIFANGVVGFKSTFSEASTVSRSVSVSTLRNNPVNFGTPSANLTLTASEKAFRITPANDTIFWYEEKDSSTWTPPVFVSVPAGRTKTIYPTYSTLCLGTVDGSTLNVETMS